jgi:hypothetical protein
MSITTEALRRLAGPGEPNAAILRARHKELTTACLEHGCLVLSNPEEVKDFRAWLDELKTISPDTYKLWVATFKDLHAKRRVRRLSPSTDRLLDAVQDISELRAEWTGRTELAIVREDQAYALGLPAGEISFIDEPSHIDIAAGPVAAYSRTLEQLRELAAAGVCEHGDSRELFWDRVLRALAAEAHVVTVLDRYLFKGMIRWRSGFDTDVVPWLLTRIDELDPPRQRRVVVMGAIDPEQPDTFPRSARAAAELIRAHWAPLTGGGIREIEVVGLRRWPAHDRHISFDLGVAIGVPAGFDRFARRTIQQAEGVEWSYRWSPRAMRKHATEESRVTTSPGVQTASAFERPPDDRAAAA